MDGQSTAPVVVDPKGVIRRSENISGENSNSICQPVRPDYGGAYNWRDRSANANDKNNEHSRNARLGSRTGWLDYGGVSNSRSKSANANDNKYEHSYTKGSRRGWGNYSQGGRRGNDGRPRFGYKKMQWILEQSPEEALLEIIKLKEDILKYIETDVPNDCIVLMVMIFAKILHGNFLGNIADVLTIFMNSTFIVKLQTFITCLQIQSVEDRRMNRHFWDDMNSFWSNLCFVCNGILDVIPTKAIQVLQPILQLITINMPLVKDINDVTASDEVMVAFEDLQVKMVLLIEKQLHALKRKNEKQVDEEEAEPIDDYRTINIFPTSEELLAKDSYAVRKNKVHGGYTDVKQYLDIQFRLLREDFVAPLRNGIVEHLKNQKASTRGSNVKIYKDVVCISKVLVNSDIGRLIQVFRKGQLKNVERTRRLMFGSLVIFTMDNFQTMIFGTVIDRDIKYLKKGQVVVNLNENKPLDFDKTYTMVECLVYFEPYYQVLKALQNMSHDRFPMQRYLLEVKIDKLLPGYMDSEDKLVYTICSIKYVDEYGNEDDLLTNRVRQIPKSILNETHELLMNDVTGWPDSQTMGLNSAQYGAFKEALTSKFCIIQGPPGTGKTYMGLKIARLLLKNHQLWQSQGPMLVICYTNHALDQFLQGLLHVTEKLIRVGGQSKNSVLNKFNLKEWRRSSIMGGAFQKKQLALRDQMLKLHCMNSEYNQMVEVEGVPDLFHEDGFGSIDPQFDSSWFICARNDDIRNWLMGSAKYWNVNLEEIINNYQEEELIEDFNIDDRKKQYGLELDDSFLNNVKEIKENLLISLPKIKKKVNEGIRYIKMLGRNTNEYNVQKKQLYHLVQQKEYLDYYLNTLKNNNMEKPVVNLRHPYLLEQHHRWELLGYWMNNYKIFLRKKIDVAEQYYTQLYKEYEEVKEIEDAILMKKQHVIGITTTGAARLQKSLMMLNCPIVIVEEAAEVLEAHVVTALSEKCQQLILIGDHKQLRPSTADFNIDKRYNLGISLFERMILNGFNSNTLDIQHRMRPEIAALVSPSIYPTLKNHESVMNYPPIKGVAKSLFFITHNNPETESSDQSKENIFEVHYLLMLANYLVLNDYDPEDITILSAYSGQFFQFLNKRKEYPRLYDVKITILDNYQGEENEIILLSLVRNNAEGKIGFLHLENRVCVALSRARQGMYIMGNIDLLCKNSKIWPKMRDVLEAGGCLGTALPMKCYNHPDNVTLVANIEDFNQVPEGGCTTICNQMKDCGHVCSSMCHILPHRNYYCNERCIKILCEFEHQCPKLCDERCELCQVPKLETLPCNHIVEIPCHENVNTFKCPTIVEATLSCGHTIKKMCSTPQKQCVCTYKCEARIEPCGHACRLDCHINRDPNHIQYKCFQNCDRNNEGCSMPDNPSHKCNKICSDKCSPCDIVVKKKRTLCSHSHTVPCCIEVDSIPCTLPCKKLIQACGHACKSKCYEECGNCEVMVMKTIQECGHKIKFACSVEPTRKFCKDDCEVVLRCGHKCTNKCNVDCYKNPCRELVHLKNRTSLCGHVTTVPCYLQETISDDDALKYCTEMCSTMLECGHLCPGTCGTCHQGRLHVACNQKCNTTLVCGHECIIPCRSMCQPCTRPCLYRCSHSKCKQMCGNACTPCKENCPRQCEHVRCKKKCGDNCDVPPCTEPCKAKLSCGHQCIGYCGDVCPAKCLICDEDEVKEVFFGTEDQEDARFVCLIECGHIFEGSSLDEWFKSSSNNESISVIVCPKCKTPVTTTQRYADYVKMSISHLNKVKRKFEGKKKQNIIEYKGLRLRANQICLAYGTKIKTLIPVKMIKHLNNNPNQQLIEDCKSKFNILEDLCEAYTSAKVTNVKGKTILNKSLQILLEYLENLTNVSKQTVKDYPLEMKRFLRIKQMCEIIETACTEHESLPEYTACRNLLFAPVRFSDERDQLALEHLKIFNEKAKTGLNITEKERREIVTAMGMTKGHWFKCPKGHVYAIGDCGGAMVRSKCNECGEQIGGTNHQLLTTNSLSTEMDGARHAAWSEIANLANYRDF